MSDTYDMVTLAEASRRLQIGLRRTYRYAARLPDTDRALSADGRKLVSLSALSRLLEASAPAVAKYTPMRFSARLVQPLPPFGPFHPPAAVVGAFNGPRCEH